MDIDPYFKYTAGKGALLNVFVCDKKKNWNNLKGGKNFFEK